MYTAGIRKKPWQRFFILVLSFILVLGTLPMSLAHADEITETPVGPGGVGAPALWLRSDLGMGVASGQKVSNWEDQGSKINNAAQDLEANQPTYWDDKSHNINFNPVLEYNGTSNFMKLDVDKLPQGKSPRSIITVSKTNRASGLSYIISWGKSDPEAYSGIGMLQNVTRGGLTPFNTSMDQTLYTAEGFLGTAFPNEQFVTWTGGDGDTNQARLYSKMKQVQELKGWGKENAKLWDTGSSDGAIIGKLIPEANKLSYWQGTIEEIIVYDRALTDEERQQVSTYLAIKYGYTLDQSTANSYVDSNKTTIWDSNDNAAYTHRITSIGRDDQSGLMQKQAKAQENGSILTMALGESVENTNSANQNDFSNDSSFFTFGDNGANTEFKTPMTKDEKNLLLMERIYKVQKTNWNDTQITLQVDQAGGTTGRPQYVVISDDEQFDAQDSIHLIENGQVTINTSNFGPNSHFTIATAVDKTKLKAKADEINGKIETGELDKEEYTPETWQTLQGALEAAQTVLNDENATQTTVDEALQALNDAYEKLEKVSTAPVVDKTKLKAKADEINGKIETGELDKEEYTPATWQTLQEALEAAQTVLNDENATQTAVDEALQALNEAYEKLEKVSTAPVVDKTKLKAKADEINGKIETGELDKEEYTPATWQTLQGALEAAQTVFNDENATQTAVDEALQALNEAYEKLEKVSTAPVVDKTKLKAKADEINGKIETGELDKEEYTPETWQTLQGALEAAQTVFNDENATQTAVDEALQALNEARNGLTKVPGTDTSTLQTLIPSVGSLSPAFDPGKDTYTMSVPNSVYQFQLTPTALDPHAKIEISVGNGDWQNASNGAASESLPLQVGGNTIIVKVTDSLGHVTEYRINVNRASSDNGNNGGGNNGGGNTGGNGGNNGGGNTGGNGGSTPAPSPAPVPTPTPTAPKDNLETTRDGNDQPFATSKPSGDKQTLVQVDPAKLNAAMSQGTGQQFAIHSPNEGDMKVDGLTLETLKQLTDQGSKLNISNPLAIYPVPGGKMDLNGVSKQLGNVAMNDISVHVDIARSSDALISSAKNKALADGYELLVNPVDLDLTFTKDGQTVRSGQLNGYAPKYIALPEGIDPNRITTGVIVNPDGSIFHVPTVVTKIDNRYYALINDLRSSGSYSVIWNPQDFEDARTHWGKTDVNNIAARLDLKGNGDNTFSPDRSVTRSEFAEIVVNGLGLMAQDAPQVQFPDVSPSDWYRNSVAIASDFDIITGYDDGYFKGSQQITREQGFAMVARAYRLIQSGNVPNQEQIASELARYEDAADLSSWAKEDVAQLIQAGIIQGNGPEVLSPKASMTRAEVTALIARMLKLTNLIDK